MPSPPARIGVTVKPGSKAPGIAFENGEIVVRVRERAVEGAANEACIRALARALDVAPSNVALIRGAQSRRKVFAVEGMSREEVARRLSS